MAARIFRIVQDSEDSSYQLIILSLFSFYIVDFFGSADFFLFFLITTGTMIHVSVQWLA